MTVGACWACALLPLYLAVTTVSAVLSTHQGAPYMDQWGSAADYRAYLADGFRLENLWAQHNEHRLVFPRLVFLADYLFAGGSNYLNTAVIGLIQLAGALFFLRVASRDGLSPLKAAALAVAVAALVSLGQWENFVWGFQVQFVGVYACAAWALHLFCQSARDRPRIDWPRLAISLALLAVATFCMANGMLVGAAMFAVAVVARFPWRMAAAALAATALLAVAYLHNFHFVSGHSPPSLALTHPADLAAYLATYLGNWLGLKGLGPPRLLGWIGAGGAVAMTALVLARRSRDPAQLALFGVVVFVALSAAMTAVGRLFYGPEQALGSRYLTPTGWFWSAQLMFWTLRAEASRAHWFKGAVALALAAAAWLLVTLQPVAAVTVAEWRDRVALGADALLAQADDPEAVKALFPDPAMPLELSPFLRARNASIFAAPEARWTGRRLDATLERAPPGACQGALDAWAPAPAGAAAWRATGWAWDVAAARPVERVLLAGGHGVIIGLGGGGSRRDDVDAAVPGIDDPRVGWAAVARTHGASPVTAYAVLSDGRACEIGRRAFTTEAEAAASPRR